MDGKWVGAGSLRSELSVTPGSIDLEDQWRTQRQKATPKLARAGREHDAAWLFSNQRASLCLSRPRTVPALTGPVLRDPGSPCHRAPLGVGQGPLCIGGCSSCMGHGWDKQSTRTPCMRLQAGLQAPGVHIWMQRNSASVLRLGCEHRGAWCRGRGVLKTKPSCIPAPKLNIPKMLPRKNTLRMQSPHQVGWALGQKREKSMKIHGKGPRCGPSKKTHQSESRITL